MLKASNIGLLMLIAVGCSVTPNAITPAQSSTPSPTLTPTVVTSIATPTALSTPTATATSPNTGSTRIIILQTTVSTSLASSSPTILRTTTPIIRTGWKTYVNSNLHLAVDYPPDWVVRVQDNDVVFTSPQNVTIQLTPIDPRAMMPSDEIIQPNTRCTNMINPNGIAVRSCLSTIGVSLDAYLELKPASGAEIAVAISTRNRAAFDVFNALVESARDMP